MSKASLPKRILFSYQVAPDGCHSSVPSFSWTYLHNVSFAVTSRRLQFHYVQALCPNVSLPLRSLSPFATGSFMFVSIIAPHRSPARVINPSSRHTRRHVHMTQPASKRPPRFSPKLACWFFPTVGVRPRTRISPDPRPLPLIRSRQPLRPPCSHNIPLPIPSSKLRSSLR